MIWNKTLYIPGAREIWDPGSNGALASEKVAQTSPASRNQPPVVYPSSHAKLLRTEVGWSNITGACAPIPFLMGASASARVWARTEAKDGVRVPNPAMRQDAVTTGSFTANILSFCITPMAAASAAFPSSSRRPSMETETRKLVVWWCSESVWLWAHAVSGAFHFYLLGRSRSQTGGPRPRKIDSQGPCLSLSKAQI